MASYNFVICLHILLKHAEGIGALTSHYKQTNQTKDQMSHGDTLPLSLVPPIKVTGRHGFGLAAPVEWNRLPINV